LKEPLPFFLTIWIFLFAGTASLLANRPLTSTTPGGKITATTYFNNNLVKTLQEPSLQTTTFAYNARNLVSSKIDPVGTTTYSYDDSTLLKTVTEGAASIQRSYDERGRLKSFTTTDGDLLQYGYDANNNLTRLTYPDGKQVSYAYNARNVLETVTDWSSRVTSYQYDRIGRLTGVTRPNGTSCAIARDAASQLLSVREAKNGKLFSYLSFNYDLAGQIKNRFYAPLVQAAWQQPSFAATYDDDNRLLTVNGSSISHDADGNMTLGPISPTPGSINLTYNSRNQLTNASGVSYTYDAEGRRRTSIDATGTTRDVIDPNGGKLLIRNHPNGSKTYYVYGLGLMYEVSQTNQTKTYHFDQVGSTIARTDDTGNVIGRAAYSAYGLTTFSEGDMATPFKYNGQAGVITEKNGLLFMRARYYSPYLMRFLNADPSGFSGGPNWYSYADGNPVSLSDPFGLCARCTSGGTSGSGSVPYPTWGEVGPWIHGGLDGLGLIPGAGEFADGVGALIYAAEGNYTDAAIGAAAMIPIAGWGATGGKALRYGDEAFEIGEGVRRAKAADILGQENIMAKIIREGQDDVYQELPISSLRSPKDFIDASNFKDAERFGETLEMTRKSPVGLGNAIEVRPGGNGLPIRDVNIKYSGGR
jgi:RHS repeat-associated protein